MLLNINATRGTTDCCSATHGLLPSEATGLWDAESIIFNRGRSAASWTFTGRVGRPKCAPEVKWTTYITANLVNDMAKIMMPVSNPSREGTIECVAAHNQAVSHITVAHFTLRCLQLKGALYRIWCGVSRLGDSGVKVV